MHSVSSSYLFCGSLFLVDGHRFAPAPHAVRVPVRACDACFVCACRQKLMILADCCTRSAEASISQLTSFHIVLSLSVCGGDSLVWCCRSPSVCLPLVATATGLRAISLYIPGICIYTLYLYLYNIYIYIYIIRIPTYFAAGISNGAKRYSAACAH